MNPEAAWDELAASALLGTDRRPFTPPTVAEPLASLLAGLTGRSPETALLGTAAAISLFRRAGRRPPKDRSTPLEPVEIDDRPVCSDASKGHLALILGGIHADVLPEWLDLLNQAGLRPPDETVPDLLELARSRAELRSQISLAVGPLGRWLARQNRDWSFASGPGQEAVPLDDEAAIETLWQTGSVAERTAILRQIRESEPAKARALVQSTWTTEMTDARASFLGIFGAGLTLDDEPFLEAALDDGRKPVRTAASELLRRLPNSALVARMIERVTPLLKLVETSSGEIVIEATLPESRDKAMTRDGIESKFSGYLDLGEKATWLYQMIARVPPSHWSRAWGRSPAELARAAVLSEWNEALYPGLIDAAISHNDDEWNDALVAHCLPAGTKANLLIQIMAQSPGRREAMVMTMIRNITSEDRLGANLDAYMNHIPAPWSDDLSRLALERSSFFTTMGDRYHVSSALGNLGLRLSTRVALAIPPNLTFPVADPPAYLIEHINTHFEQYQALIQFRHEMTQELRR